MRSPRRTTVLATVLALVIVACSGDDPSSSAAPTSVPISTTSSPSSTSTSSTTPGESTTSPSTPSSPSPEGGSCPAAEGSVPPPGATDVSEASADVDGDGEADQVLTYRQSDGDRRVAVELSAGGTAAVDASESTIDGPATLSVLGGTDVGGDGQTVFAITGAGASVVVVGLFQFVECALARVVLPSGQPAEFPVGGGITHGDGLACIDDNLLVLSATSIDGEDFSTTDTRYRIDGNTLVSIGGASVTHTSLDDRYYSIDCPGLERGL